MSAPPPPYPQGDYNTNYGGGYTQPQYGQNAPPPPGFNPGYNPYGGQQGGPQGGFPPPMPPPMPHLAPQSGGNEYYDPENGQPKHSGFGFDDKTIRRGFIRKVFSILTVQLLVVVAFIAFFLFHQPANEFVKRNRALYWVSYGVFLVTYIALACCESVRRKHPTNLIAAALLTFAIGYMTAMISAFYDTTIVFMAMAICTLVCGAIIIFAMQTRFDFTKLIGVMFVVFMVAFVFGIVAIIAAVVWKIKFLYIIYSGVMALIFMVYLAIDVQMVMGGRKFEISPEDYVFAAIQLFLDIIYIFWMLLSLFGNSN